MRFYFAYLPKEWGKRGRGEWPYCGIWQAARFMVGKNLWEPAAYNIRWLWKVPFLPYALYEKKLVSVARCVARGDRELPPDIAAKIQERPNDPALYSMPMEALRKAAGL